MVGGGPVALRKTRQLLRAGATVEVVAPQFVAELEELAAAISQPDDVGEKARLMAYARG